MWPVLIKEKEVVWTMFNGMYIYLFSRDIVFKVLFHVNNVFDVAAFYMYPEGSAIVSFHVWILFFVFRFDREPSIKPLFKDGTIQISKCVWLYRLLSLPSTTFLNHINKHS